MNIFGKCYRNNDNSLEGDGCIFFIYLSPVYKLNKISLVITLHTLVVIRMLFLKRLHNVMLAFSCKDVVCINFTRSIPKICYWNIFYSEKSRNVSCEIPNPDCICYLRIALKTRNICKINDLYSINTEKVKTFDLKIWLHSNRHKILKFRTSLYFAALIGKKSP